MRSASEVQRAVLAAEGLGHPLAVPATPRASAAMAAPAALDRSGRLPGLVPGGGPFGRPRELDGEQPQSLVAAQESVRVAGGPSDHDAGRERDRLVAQEGSPGPG